MDEPCSALDLYENTPSLDFLYFEGGSDGESIEKPLHSTNPCPKFAE